jgi:hypothetical protein
MAPLTQYNSQVSAPVASPVYANNQPVSTAAADMVGSLGQSLQRVGNQASDERQLKALMQEKYQSHLDDLKTMEANDILKVGSIEMQSIYENSPPEDWEKLISAKAKEVSNRASKLTSYMSGERRDFVEKQLRSFENVEIAKMESLRLKEVKNRNHEALLASIQTGMSEGNKEQASTAKQALLDKWQDFGYASPDAALIAAGEAEQRGQNEFDVKMLDVTKNEIAAAVKYSPDSAIDIAEAYSKENGLSESQTASMRSYASSISNQFKVDNRLVYDNIIGQAAQGFRKSFVNGTLTEQSIDEAVIKVPQEYQADLDNYLDSWRTRIRTRNESIAKGEKIATDWQEKTRLKSMAKSVGIGAITKAEVERQTFDARQKKTIGDDDVTEIMNLAETEREQRITKVMSREESQAKSQLVDGRYSEPTVFEAFLAGIMKDESKTMAQAQAEVERQQKRRQIQLWNYGRYQDEIDDFVSSNPDATDEQIKQKSLNIYLSYMKSDVELEREWKDSQSSLLVQDVKTDIEAEIKKAYPAAYFQDGVWLVDINGVPMRIKPE